MSSVRFDFKRIVASALVLLTVVGTALFTSDFGTVPEVEAATVSEYQQYIKDLEAEQKEIKKEINKLKGDKRHPPQA